MIIPLLSKDKIEFVLNKYFKTNNLIVSQWLPISGNSIYILYNDGSSSYEWEGSSLFLHSITITLDYYLKTIRDYKLNILLENV